jgi:acyl-CoA thioesterase
MNGFSHFIDEIVEAKDKIYEVKNYRDEDKFIADELVEILGFDQKQAN